MGGRVKTGVWVSQGLQSDNQDIAPSPPEACSPPFSEASIVQAHTLTCGLQQAQSLQGSVTNDSKGPIPTSEPHLHIPDNQCNATSLTEAYSSHPEKAFSDQTTPLVCEVKHVQSLLDPTTHGSEDTQHTSKVHPEISGDISTYPVHLKEQEVTPVPSLSLQTNNKHENLKFIYQTQHNVYSNQKEKPVALKERDGMTGGSNDDISCSGDDNDDDGQDD